MDTNMAALPIGLVIASSEISIDSSGIMISPIK
jgi:hypothetical protein